VTGADDVEPIDAFAERAARWLPEHLPSWDDPRADDLDLQHRLADGGFVGIAFPREYGGAGLTLQHQKAFFDAAAQLQRQVPTAFLVSIGILGPTILDHGSHEAKLRFLPPLLRADEVWMQLLSEPRGGSDMAGALTRLTRDGSSYVLNGAKMWSTGAHHADYGLCLARTNFDAPKHRGLSMIAVPLKGTPGLTIEQIRAANGLAGEFCQEFFDDVVLPAENLIGDENEGWTVAQTLLFHERNLTGGIGYGCLGFRQAGAQRARRSVGEGLAGVLNTRGSTIAARAVADAYIEEIVIPLTSVRIMAGMRAGTHRGQWGSVSKLQGSVAGHANVRAALAVHGADAVVWDGDEVELDNPGTEWLGSRGGTIAGGTNEMQRNIISERLLGLPREPSFDRDVPFSEVLRRRQPESEGSP
jgi:alkylation response protein AidB-like acyl-CoA dehydrogenase